MSFKLRSQSGSSPIFQDAHLVCEHVMWADAGGQGSKPTVARICARLVCLASGARLLLNVSICGKEGFLSFVTPFHFFARSHTVVGRGSFVEC